MIINLILKIMKLWMIWNYISTTITTYYILLLHTSNTNKVTTDHPLRHHHLHPHYSYE